MSCPPCSRWFRGSSQPLRTEVRGAVPGFLPKVLRIQEWRPTPSEYPDTEHLLAEPQYWTSGLSPSDVVYHLIGFCMRNQNDLLHFGLNLTVTASKHKLPHTKSSNTGYHCINRDCHRCAGTIPSPVSNGPVPGCRGIFQLPWPLTRMTLRSDTLSKRSNRPIEFVQIPID